MHAKYKKIFRYFVKSITMIEKHILRIRTHNIFYEMYHKYYSSSIKCRKHLWC